MANESKFFVAPFANAGELVGVGAWELSALSPEWLGLCERMLRELGPTFHVALEGPLSHLEIKLTSAGGAGLGTFYAHGHIVISTAYLRGLETHSEDEMLQMFVSSLRRVELVQRFRTDESPFGEIFSVSERPLHVVVAWGNPNVSEEDERLIEELSNHFAGAFLCSCAS